MQHTLKHLSNNAKLLIVPTGAPSLTALILFGVGSRYETTKLNGISHFLEHLFFKGSKKRPTAQMIAEEVDAIGGEMNAFTSKEYTGYYIKAAGNHGELVLDVLSDMLKNPLFDPAEIDRERGVITEEIKMYEDQPMIYVGELFEEQMYGDTSLGRQVIGTRENIALVSRENFLHHLKTFYTADNMVIVLAGDVSKIKDKAEHYFADFNGAKGQAASPFSLSASKPRFRMYTKKTEQTHVWVGFPAVSHNHPDRFAVKVLSAILGGGMSSRLFLSVRERRGLAYYVRCNVESFLDTGYIAASAGVTTEKFEEAMTTILDELKLVRDESVTDKELQKAKEYLKGKLLLHVEQSDGIAEVLGMQALLQKEVLTPAEINARIDGVTAADVARVAQALFVPEKLYAAVISSHNQSSWLDTHLVI